MLRFRSIFPLLLVAALVLPMRPSLAQGAPADSAGAAQPPQPSLQWVELDGRKLFTVRGASSYPAEQRAADVARRIEAAARDPTITPAAIHIVQRPAATEVLAGQRSLVAAIDLDANAEGVHRDVLAESQARRIRQAIETYRYERGAQYLRGALTRSLLATLAGAVALWIVLFLLRRVRLMAEARYKRRVHDIAIQSFAIVGAGQIWAGLTALLRSLSWLAAATAAYLYVQYVLSQFPWTRALANRLLDLVANPLSAMSAAVLRTLPDVIFLALLFIIVRYVLRLARLFFDSVENQTLRFESFDADWAAPTYRAVRLLIVLFALVVAYPHIPGSQSDAFKGLSLLVGVMFSIGSSSFVANLIAGYALTYRRVFTIGEWIRIDDKFGQVMHKRLQVTHLRTPKNEEVIVPNSLILSTPVINYSKLAREQGLILHTNVGIGYETPWRQVEAMLLLAAQRTTHLQSEPTPFVLQRALNDFSIDYEINAYCRDAGAMFRAMSELHRNILDIFNEHGVQIMTPAYEGDPEQPKVVQRDQWFAPPARPTDVSPTVREPAHDAASSR